MQRVPVPALRKRRGAQSRLLRPHILFLVPLRMARWCVSWAGEEKGEGVALTYQPTPVISPQIRTFAPGPARTAGKKWTRALSLQFRSFLRKLAGGNPINSVLPAAALPALWQPQCPS